MKTSPCKGTPNTVSTILLPFGHAHPTLSNLHVKSHEYRWDYWFLFLNSCIKIRHQSNQRDEGKRFNIMLMVELGEVNAVVDDLYDKFEGKVYFLASKTMKIAW